MAFAMQRFSGVRAAPPALPKGLAPARLGRAADAAATVPSAGKKGDRVQVDPGEGVSYGDSWYEQTRNAGGVGGQRGRTVREEIEYRRAANWAANNGKERKDLYTDNWDGSEWKGDRFNILSLVVGLFFLVPVLGLAFAFLTYGELWG